MLHAKKGEITVGRFQMGDQAFETTLIYGNNCSVMRAERPAGYHSRPHRHDCEQINYVVEGELTLFIEDKYYVLKAGDYSRSPANAIHWAWNRSDKPAIMMEVHSPGMQNDPKCSRYAYPMFGENEEPSLLGEPVNNILEGEDIDALVLKAEAPFMK